MATKSKKNAYIVTLKTDEPVTSREGAQALRYMMDDANVGNDAVVEKITVSPVGEK